MFGYINVNHKELSEEDKQAYQAYYCGLCHALRKNSGVKGQMLLSHDMTFLVVLLTGLYELNAQEKLLICPLHPGKKKLAYVNEATEYASEMNVLLAYYNLVDDWEDDKSYPKHVLSSMLKKDFARISRKYPRQARAVENYINRLNMLEKKREENIDAISCLTGEMLGEIFVWKDDVWAEELHCLGFYMGKFIYLMDAYEDLKKDQKRNEYNPFETMAKDRPADYELLAKLILTSMMSECAKSFERMPILQHAEIIRNILYSGVWSKYEYLQRKNEKKKKAADKKEADQKKAEQKAAERDAVKAAKAQKKSADRDKASRKEKEPKKEKSSKKEKTPKKETKKTKEAIRISFPKMPTKKSQEEFPE